MTVSDISTTDGLRAAQPQPSKVGQKQPQRHEERSAASRNPGARPSPVAAIFDSPQLRNVPDALGTLQVAATGDGRTPGPSEISSRLASKLDDCSAEMLRALLALHSVFSVSLW